MSNQTFIFSSVKYDPILCFSAFCLVLIGIVMKHYTNAPSGDSYFFSTEVIRQCSLVLFASVFFLAASRLNYQILRYFHWLTYLFGIGCLVLVMLIGSNEFGAQRWIIVGSYSLQPSELTKIAIFFSISTLAAINIPNVKNFIYCCILVFFPAALILIQPDLGTVLVVIVTWLLFMFVWPIPWRGLLTTFAVIIAFLPIIFAVLIPAYQRERLAVFLDPERDPLGSGFTLRQVELAMSSGGVFGHGLEKTESLLQTLSTRESDFIYAAIAEQFGLIAALLVILLIAIIFWRGISIAQNSRDIHGKLLATSLTGLLVVPAIMHIAVNLRLFPATGIPLTFVSSGGTALMASAICIGLLCSIATIQERSPLEDERYPNTFALAEVAHKIAKEKT